MTAWRPPQSGDDVEYAELSFNNGKNKYKSNKKANGTVRPNEDSTIYATIDHARTAQQQQQQQQMGQQNRQTKHPPPHHQHQPVGSKAGRQQNQHQQGVSPDLDSPVQREPDEIPLMDAALESSVWRRDLEEGGEEQWRLYHRQ